MVMRFPLSDHIHRILTGSDDQVSKGRGMILICAARNCLHHPEGSPDPDFGRLIEPEGYGVCSRCKLHIDIEEMEKKGCLRHFVCSKCGNQCMFTTKQIEWTVKVVSKHRHGKHFYYHEECYDAMFVECDDKEETDKELNDFFADA